jgi:peroxiredoxin
MFKINITWIRNTIYTLLFLLLILGVRSFVQRTAISGQAPAFVGVLQNGTQVNLHDYRGSPVLVHFWASWCSICQLEEKSIESISRDYPVITVATQSGNADEVRAYMTRQGLNFPVVMDEQGELANLYGAIGVPVSYIIDSDGEVRFVEFGYSTEIGLRVRMWLAS